jgi:SAM-dependent methyltransferase
MNEHVAVGGLSTDTSNGWDAVAERFLAVRSSAGAAVVSAWSKALPAGSDVLDLGCGSGQPIAAALDAAGCRVYGVDASPRLVAAFARRFPQHRVVCETVEASSFYGMRFDAAVAVGLLFLLPPVAQCTLIERVAGVLKPGGRFLFSAPVQQAEWTDLLTGRPSVSLGEAAYRTALHAAGLRVGAEHVDEGGSHYYDAVRSP